MASMYKSHEEIINMSMQQYTVWRQGMSFHDMNQHLLETYEYLREMFAKTGDQYYLDKMLEKVEPYGE